MSLEGRLPAVGCNMPKCGRPTPQGIQKSQAVPAPRHWPKQWGAKLQACT